MTIAQQLRQEGIITAQQKAVLEALEIRFDQVPQGLRETIEAIQDELCLRNLLRAAIQAASIEVFTHAL